MNLIGRYRGVRGWNGQDISAPYILDLKWGRMTPMKSNEWWKAPDGMWIPTVSGGVTFGGSHRAIRISYPGPSGATAPTLNAVALSSNYVAGTGGNAIGSRIIWPENLTITDIYFFITSYTGTAASVTDINWEVRSGTTVAPTTTAGALVASGSVNPSSATGWIVAATGQSITLTAGTNYYVIIGDANGNNTNFANVNARYTQWPDGGASTVFMPDYFEVQTTNGFTATSVNAGVPGIFCVFNDNTVVGQPFTAAANSTSGTNRRGFYISTGLISPLTIWGIVSGNTNANFSGAELYYGSSTTPGTSPTTPTQVVVTDGTGTKTAVLFSPSAKIPTLTPTRVVFTYSGNSTAPQKISIGTGADANLRSGGALKGQMYWAEANGTTNWANDDTNAIPSAFLLVDDQVISTMVSVNE